MKCFLVMLLTLLIGTTSLAVGVRPESYSTIISPGWHHEDNIEKAFRANASHFWDWLKDQKENETLLEPEGVVVGDPHLQNFADVQLANGGREFALVDVDDAGVQAPLVGDLIRYASGNQISQAKISLSSLFKAYVDGLKDKPMKEPDILREALSHSKSHFYKRQNSYVAKMSSQNKFSDKAKLTAIEDASLEVQELFEQSHAVFEAAMTGYEILDMGYKTKLSGGSQGLPRFWYLLKKNHRLSIVEFKLEVMAATSFYSEQGEPEDRFPKVVNVYRPAKKAYGPYDIVTTSSGSFLMRLRLDPYLDLDLEQADDQLIKDAEEMSLYVAYRLGLWHGQQAAGEKILKILRFEDFEALVKSYVKLMIKENSAAVISSYLPYFLWSSKFSDDATALAFQ